MARGSSWDIRCSRITRKASLKGANGAKERSQRPQATGARKGAASPRATAKGARGFELRASSQSAVFRDGSHQASTSPTRFAPRHQHVLDSVSDMLLYIERFRYDDIPKRTGVQMIHPTVVIGAGPSGLAAAAHLLERGQDTIVLEAGDTAGTTIREWSHVRLFSNWRSVVDGASVRRLEQHGWTMPDPDSFPTGGDIVEAYLEPLVATMPDQVWFNHRVSAISRNGLDKVVSRGRESVPFLIRVDTPTGSRELSASHVIDASGTWNTPNPMGSSGLPARGEPELADHVRYGIPDILGRERDRYASKRVLVVGAGHSAAGALLDLATLRNDEPETRPIWAIRRDDATRVYGGLSDDELEERGKLGAQLQDRVRDGAVELVAGFRVSDLKESAEGVEVTGVGADGTSARTIVVDEIIAATGQRPDLSLARELRLDLDSWLEAPLALAPLIDPNEHSCGTVPPHGVDELSHSEPDFYTVGIKSYGRAPTFLIVTGYEQVRSVAAAIAGDWEAARNVELVLPETGVCGVAAPLTIGSGPQAQPQSNCC